MLQLGFVLQAIHNALSGGEAITDEGDDGEHFIITKEAACQASELMDYLLQVKCALSTTEEDEPKGTILDVVGVTSFTCYNVLLVHVGTCTCRYM